MEYHELIDRVMKETNLQSREETAKIVEATLETLGERLSKTERENLAAQLPNELKGNLLKRHATDRFLLEEFYNRVSARADLGYPEAVKQCQAVMAILREAISPGEWRDVLSELPGEFKELFGEKPPSSLSPSSV